MVGETWPDLPPAGSFKGVGGVARRSSDVGARGVALDNAFSLPFQIFLEREPPAAGGARALPESAEVVAGAGRLPRRPAQRACAEESNRRLVAGAPQWGRGGQGAGSQQPRRSPLPL